MVIELQSSELRTCLVAVSVELFLLEKVEEKDSVQMSRYRHLYQLKEKLDSYLIVMRIQENQKFS